MLDADAVRERLDPVIPVLVASHLGASPRYRRLAEVMPEAAAAFNARERANFLHSQIRSLVAVGVESIPGMKMTTWNVDTLAVGFDLLVRFKFVGNGGPANVSTEQQRLLQQQQYTEETMELLTEAGITEPPTTVTCGYTLDGMDISTIRIQRDCKGHAPWYFGIYGDETAATPLLLPGTEEARPAVVRSARRPEALDKAEGQG